MARLHNLTRTSHRNVSLTGVLVILAFAVISLRFIFFLLVPSAAPSEIGLKLLLRNRNKLEYNCNRPTVTVPKIIGVNVELNLPIK